MARKPARPNVLWVMSDEQRTDSLGCYGSPWAATPVADRMSSEGAIFAEAVTPAPLCVPARTSMLTGLMPSETGVYSNADVGPIPRANLIASFRLAGYRTASFGKSHYVGFPQVAFFDTEEEYVLSDAVDYTGFRSGYSEERHGVVKYPSPYTRWILGGSFPLPEERTSESIAVSRALQWLDDADERPFFLRVSFNGPHTPVVPPARYFDRIRKGRIVFSRNEDAGTESWPSWYRHYLREYARADRLTDDELEIARHSYYAETAFIDDQLGRLITYLEEHALIDDTIIVYLSDHGTHLGDFGFVQKQTFFQPVVVVPMILRFPSRIAAGTVVHQPVSLVQLLPTIIEMCGIEDESRHLSFADSLAAGVEPAPRPVLSQYTFGSIEKWGLILKDHLTMVRHENWKLCFSEENEHEGLLFALDDDPHERFNLFHLGRCQGVVRRLKEAAHGGVP